MSIRYSIYLILAFLQNIIKDIIKKQVKYHYILNSLTYWRVQVGKLLTLSSEFCGSLDGRLLGCYGFLCLSDPRSKTLLLNDILEVKMIGLNCKG